MSIQKGLYRHFKGSYYQVIDVAKDSETQQEMVVYRALYGEKKLWIRPLGMFNEVITRNDIEQQRFAYCEDQSIVSEVAILDIQEGHDAAFVAAFKQVQDKISSMSGYIAHDLKQCVEHQNRYFLFVEWQRLEDHTRGFKESDDYQYLRKLLQHFVTGQPSILHYQAIDLV